jgi:hypothetical protein
MWQKLTLTSALALLLFAIGLFEPRAILLDLPFGLAFYVAELSDLWRPGPTWVIEHRPLAILCFFGWPLLLSSLLGYAAATIALRLWREGTTRSGVYAASFIIALFALILMVRAEPGIVHVSFFGHWAENY